MKRWVMKRRRKTCATRLKDKDIIIKSYIGMQLIAGVDHRERVSIIRTLFH